MQSTSTSLPTASDDPNRRSAERAPLNLLVQFKSENQDAFTRDFSKNLSSSGMFIETSTPRSEGTYLYFQFQVGHQSHYIEGLGKVVRVCDGEDVITKGMGIQFVNIDALVDQRLQSAAAH